MVLKIAILDDDKIDSQYLFDYLTNWALKNEMVIKIDTYNSSENFIFHYVDNKEYDLLLLDIEMKQINGIELAKMIRKDNHTVQIIFITGYSDYLSDGYDVEALHYLLKPVDEVKLDTVLKRAVDKINQAGRCLYLKVQGEMLQIPLYEIRYIDVVSNYITIHGTKDITVKKTLKEIETMLDHTFYKASRSLIVNLNEIRKVTKKEIYLADQTILPLPRGGYDKINRAIINNL